MYTVIQAVHSLQAILQEKLPAVFGHYSKVMEKSSFVPLPLDLSQHLRLLNSMLFCGFI